MLLLGVMYAAVELIFPSRDGVRGSKPTSHGEPR
jgi:hypothetical protein